MTSCSESQKVYIIVLMRHGQSVWNAKNLFCGWVNVDLTDRGKQEAKDSATILKAQHLTFDLAYTSVLNRASDTLDTIIKELNLTNIEVKKTWRLLERHYGALTGLEKTEAVDKFGENQVKIWRRSYDVKPPPMQPDHPFYNCIRNSPIFKDGPPLDQFPDTESLKSSQDRIQPYWEEEIVPQIRAGRKILIVSHGTSVKALIKIIEDVDEEVLNGINIPTGIPLCYHLGEDMKPLHAGKEYLGDPDLVAKGIKEVEDQLKKKSNNT